MPYHKDGSQPLPHQIFVFGSNLSGIHGAGAALAARLHYGAILGVPRGPTGRSYALPTVKHNVAGPLTLAQIQEEVQTFLEYARANPRQDFFVTRVGCGLAGHKDADIAPMFAKAPINCSLPDTWASYLETL